jgi:chromosomal replication initiator protein
MVYHPRRQWTLASFVPRRSSQHARAAGICFVAQERPALSALVLAGPPGSGKTHLLHALAQHARRNGTIDSIACLSATQWAQEVAAGLHFADMGCVLQHYACQDLLA